MSDIEDSGKRTALLALSYAKEIIQFQQHKLRTINKQAPPPPPVGIIDDAIVMIKTDNMPWENKQE